MMEMPILKPTATGAGPQIHSIMYCKHISVKNATIEAETIFLNNLRNKL